MLASPAAAKEAAAKFAVQHFLKPGMRVGLGSGSTAAFAVRALADRIALEHLGLELVIATSQETADLAVSLGIAIRPDLVPAITPLDITIDGADAVDHDLNLIKGGGGAALREKIVARCTKREIIVVDRSKVVERIGPSFPLPVIVVPYGWETTRQRLEAFCGRPASLRKNDDGTVFVSDDGLYTLDVEKGPISDPGGWEQGIRALTGVVDVGLFVGMTYAVVIADQDGQTTVWLAQAAMAAELPKTK